MVAKRKVPCFVEKNRLHLLPLQGLLDSAVEEDSGIGDDLAEASRFVSRDGLHPSDDPNLCEDLFEIRTTSSFGCRREGIEEGDRRQSQKGP
jgi:hypothetical protein